MAVKALSPNHWTTGKFPFVDIFICSEYCFLSMYALHITICILSLVYITLCYPWIDAFHLGKFFFFFFFVNCTFSLLMVSLVQHSRMVRIFVSGASLPEMEGGLPLCLPILSCPPYLITLHLWRPSVQCWTAEVVEGDGSVEILVRRQHCLDWELRNSFLVCSV